MILETLLAHPFDLPSIPRVVALLLVELDHAEVDLSKVNELIQSDPALTARLLRLANTPCFNMTACIHSVPEALALLDLRYVKTIAQAAIGIGSSKTQTSMQTIRGLHLPQFWNYSHNVAKVSRALAGLVYQNQQTAFTCGLIHAIGELAMHLMMPQSMAELNDRIPPLNWSRAKLEQQELGYCYANVSAGLARIWHFPPAIVDALEHQHAPFQDGVYEPLAGVIHLASWRVRAKESQANERTMATTFPDEVGVTLDLDMDSVLQQDPFDWGKNTQYT
ncbi:MAG: hypothetical protein RIR79_45 [Pseudomonadota bacterium]|jgi:HD-like signal output (HDOD) protein